MKTSKMIAPIVITVITVLYFLGWLSLLIFLPAIPILLRLLLGLPAVGLIGVCIFVLTERIQEIRSGEEDDLSQY